jgi:Xaa-Pro aminopeptidase
MEDPRERLVTSISTEELERRWKAAREWMRAEGVDYLLMRNDEEYFGGYVKWFTDIPARHSYPFTVIFPQDDGMTTITSSPPAEPGPKAWAVRGVKQRLGAPYYPSLNYTAAYDAELAVGVLKKKIGATVGIVGRSFIPVPFYEHLTRQLPSTRFVDATDAIDDLKAIKFPEEIELIRRTAEIQDLALDHVRKCLKPGIREVDLYAEAHYISTRLGSERMQILTCSYPPGEPAGFNQRHFMNRVIRERDTFVILIEGNGPGGYYTEIARPFSLGEPSQETKETFAAVLEAEAITLDLLRPGADPKEIWNAHNAFLTGKGLAPEGRLYAHGEGYDLVERPAIRYDETMILRAGMNLAVHPSGKSRNVWTTMCNNYLITENGVGPCLHKTPKEIIVL